MKKLMMLLAVVMAMCANAYAEHFKFMGIPIDGTLPQFEKQLLHKGFTPIKNQDANMPMMKVYEGEWLNQNVELEVYYAPQSKIVAGLDVRMEDAPSSALELVKNRIHKNYKVDRTEAGEDGDVGYDMVYYVNNGEGMIEVFYDTKHKILVVSYMDVKNFAIFEKEVMVYQDQMVGDDI